MAGRRRGRSNGKHGEIEILVSSFPSLLPIHLVNVSAANRRVHNTSKLSRRKFMFVCAQIFCGQSWKLRFIAVYAHSSWASAFQALCSVFHCKQLSETMCRIYGFVVCNFDAATWCTKKTWLLESLAKPRSCFLRRRLLSQESFVPRSHGEKFIERCFQIWRRISKRVNIYSTVLRSNLFHSSAVLEFQELPTINPSGCRPELAGYPWLWKASCVWNYFAYFWGAPSGV